MTKRPKKSRGSGYGHLSDEDSELWDFVTSSVTRLDVKRRKISRIRKPQPTTATSADILHLAKHAAPAPPPAAAPRSAPRQPEFDRREARHIARGRLEIEARLDLHGLRQNEAHRRLLGFLRSAHDQGLRYVLVITGKGGFDGDMHALPFHETLDRSPRGVLRRIVPMWLEEPSLSSIVLSYREAATQHGGAGALYVRLRSPHRSR